MKDIDKFSHKIKESMDETRTIYEIVKSKDELIVEYQIKLEEMKKRYDDLKNSCKKKESFIKRLWNKLKGE